MANGTLAVSQLSMLSQSGTGTTTINPPATNTDRTLTLPDASGTMMTTDTPVSAGQIPDGSITTAKIAANAVTAAKLAREGSSGQVLTSNGAGSDPSYQSLPAGGVTSLNGETGAITNTALDSIGNTVTGFIVGYYNAGSGFSIGATYTGVYAYTVNTSASASGSYTAVTGTWRCVGGRSQYIQGGPQSNMLQGSFVRIS